MVIIYNGSTLTFIMKTNHLKIYCSVYSILPPSFLRRKKEFSYKLDYIKNLETPEDVSSYKSLVNTLKEGKYKDLTNGSSGKDGVR